MNLYTTLKELRNHGACRGRYAYVTAILDGMSIAEAEAEESKYEDAREYRECSIDDLYKIPLVEILKHNGLDDALWALSTNLPPESDRYARLFAYDWAEHVLHVFEDKFPDDKRPRNAIEVARKSANGEATQDELDAAGDAAVDAAWAAARAAGAAERKGQADTFIDVFGGD